MTQAIRIGIVGTGLMAEAIAKVISNVETPDDFLFVATPSDKSQQEIMIENFGNLINNHSQSNLCEASINVTEKTQYLLDKILEKIKQ